MSYRFRFFKKSSGSTNKKTVASSSKSFDRRYSRTNSLNAKSFKNVLSPVDCSSEKYRQFLRLGGGRSGVYNVHDPATMAFVKEFSEFIEKKEVYTRDNNGHLVPYFENKRKV